MPALERYERFYYIDEDGSKVHNMQRAFQFGKWTVTVAEPRMARQLLESAEDAPKMLIQDLFKNTLSERLFGSNIVFSNGKIWKIHRKIIHPAFRIPTTDVFGTLGLGLIDHFNNAIQEGDDGFALINVHNWMQRITIDAIGLMAFGKDLGAMNRKVGEMVQVYNELLATVQNPWFTLLPFLQKLPLPIIKRFEENVARFYSFLDSIIEEKKRNRATTAETNDLLDSMLAAEADKETRFTMEDLRNNLLMVFLAGHDTTANSLSVSLYHLAKHSEVQDKAFAEIMESIAWSEHTVPTKKEQSELNYLTAVIKESLRLYPSVAVMPTRCLAKDIKFQNGITVPAGTLCAVNVLAANRNPDFFDKPATFDPDRFLGSSTVGANIMTFGFGTRKCIGQTFSMVEQRVLLSMILRHYEIRLPDGSPHADQLQMISGLLQYPRNLVLEFHPRLQTARTILE